MNCNKDKIIQIIGVTGTVLSVVSTLLNSWSQDKNMERIIDQKVSEALAKTLKTK